MSDKETSTSTAEQTKELAALGDVAQATANSAHATEPTAKAEPEPAKPAVSAKTDDDDDELKPDEKGMLDAMSFKSFMRRVDRLSKKALKELFGTSDLEAIAKERGELTELRSYRESVEREKLTEREKLAADKAAAEKRAEEAERRAEEVEMRAEVKETEGTLRAHVSALVEKEDIDDLLDKLQRAVTKGDVETQEEGLEWLSEYVEKHPKWKKGGGKEPEKKPLSNVGPKGPPAKPAPGSSGANEDVDYKKMDKREILKRTGYRL